MGVQARQTANPAPERVAAPAGERLPQPDNSLVVQQLAAQPIEHEGSMLERLGSGTTPQHADLPAVERAGSGLSTRANPTVDGTSVKTDDPSGRHLVHTSTTHTRTRAPTQKGGRQQAGTSRADTTSNAAGVSDNSLMLSRTTRQADYRGANGSLNPDRKPTEVREQHTGASVDLGNPLDTALTHSRTTTDRDGNSTSTTGTVNRNGAQGTRAWSDGTNSHAVSVNGTWDLKTVGGSYGYSRQTGPSSAIGGSLGGSYTFARPESKVTTAENATGAQGAALDTLEADQLLTWQRQGGWSVNAGVNAQAGVVGVKANGYYGETNGVGFHTTGREQLSATEQARYGTRANTLAELQKSDPSAAEDYLGRYDALLHDDQGRVTELGNLPVDALRPGQALTLDTSTSFGGGAGLSVYGVGGSGSYDKAQAQRTAVVRNADGSMTFDITTADQQKAEGNAEVLGALQAGGSASWGDAANVRFTFSNDEQGQRALQDFMKTGVLPGAMNERDPANARYRELADKKDLSKREQAELREMADRVNAGAMERFAGGPPATGPGVRYDGGNRIENKASEGHVRLLGLGLGESGSTHAEGRHWYREGDSLQVGFSNQHTDQHWWADDEAATSVFNPRGALDTSVSAELTGDDHLGLYPLAGEKTPDVNSGIFGGKLGNGYDDIHKLRFALGDGDAATFRTMVGNVDLSKSLLPYGDAVNREKSARHALAAPVGDGALADQVHRNRGGAEADRLMAAMSEGGEVSPQERERYQAASMQAIAMARAREQSAARLMDVFRPLPRSQDPLSQLALGPRGSGTGFGMNRQLPSLIPQPTTIDPRDVREALAGGFTRDSEMAQVLEGKSDAGFLEGAHGDELTRATAMVRDDQHRALQGSLADPFDHTMASLRTGGDLALQSQETIARLALSSQDPQIQLMASMMLEGEFKSVRAQVFNRKVRSAGKDRSIDAHVGLVRDLSRLQELPGMDRDQYRAFYQDRTNIEYK